MLEQLENFTYEDETETEWKETTRTYNFEDISPNLSVAEKEIKSSAFLPETEQKIISCTCSFDDRYASLSAVEEKIASSANLPLREKPEVTFDTGSSYIGQWNALGMEGYGTYTLFTGTKHEGMMKDGMFHGHGILNFPNNSRMEGIWKDGKLTDYDYFYADGLHYGPYCEMPDRRFNAENKFGLQPAGRSYITIETPSRQIPDGFYDTIDGFYNPKTRCVVDADNLKHIIRIPTETEDKWILKNCRKSGDDHVGYRPDLYEDWLEDDVEVSTERNASQEKKKINFLKEF